MNDNKIIGFTCSCFDLLHGGHILMLKDAKNQCDYLIVGLQTDPTLDRPEKNKPIQSLKERKIQLEAVKYIDERDTGVAITTHISKQPLNYLRFMTHRIDFIW